jgi:hypothetical protein
MDSKIEAVESKITKLEEEIETTTDITLKSDLIKLLTARCNEKNILLQQREGGHVGRQSRRLTWQYPPS